MRLWFLLLPACTSSPERDGMVRIPASPGTAGDPSEGVFPMAATETFWIDAYEFPNTVGQPPQVFVNLEMARASCAEQGKRLCTAAEWRRACLGPSGRNRFGYGPVFEPDRCHTSQHLPSGHTSMMNPEDHVKPAGSYGGCVTPEGVYDLVGNVEEWVLDDWNGRQGMLEGGAWYTFTAYADCTGRYSREPDYRIDPKRKVFSAGFRCCVSEEAPAEEDLTPDDLRADAAVRLAAAPSDRVPYDPLREVEIGEGRFMDVFEYPNRPGVYAWTGISWSEALALCQAAGKRLCESRELEQVCMGGTGNLYPYGQTWISAACADSRSTPARIGEHLGCAAPSGVFDLTGGIWEWTATPLDLPGISVAGEKLREIHGGSWFSDPSKATCVSINGYAAAAEDARFPDLGFRCCRGEAPSDDPTPSPGVLSCPEGMVAIGTGAGSEPVRPFCIDRWEYPSQKGSVPTGNLDFASAVVACTQRGLRVCTWAEWRFACEGTQGRRWPYGSVYVPERCADESRARETHESTASPSGSHPECVTPEGVEDLSGNLWEWVVVEGSEGSYGILAGGGWNVGAGLGKCLVRATSAQDYRTAETGTRCCAGPDELAILGQRSSAP